MLKIMADHNVRGHLQILLNVWTSPKWNDLWTAVACQIESFEIQGLSREAADAEVWNYCQQEGIILITGNRNAKGDDSLQATINALGTSDCLPVLTIGDPDRLMADHDYAERTATQVLQFLLDLDNIRGAGRLYVP